MKALAFGALLAIALAGCGQATHPLSPYMMEVLDAPDACYYVSVEEEPWATAAAFAGIDSNPGAADNRRMVMGGVTPQANRVAAMECRFSEGTSQYVSAAMRFSDAASAEAWLAAAQEQSSGLMRGARCVPQALVFTDGEAIGLIGTLSSQWHPAFQQAATERFDAIRKDTGAQDYCA